MKNSVFPIMLRYNETGYNTEKIFLEWIQQGLKLFYDKNKISNKKKLVFIVDDATFHSTENIIKACSEMDIELITLPGGTTSVLQPLDVVIINPSRIT